MEEEGGINSGELARDTVAQLVENQNVQGREPNPKPLYIEDQDPPRDPPDVAELTVEVDEYGEPVTQRVAPQPVVDESFVAGGEPLTDEMYDELLSYGIDLGVPPSELGGDPTIRKVYQQLADSVIGIVAESRTRVMQAEQSRLQVDEFMKKVETNPQDVLMLIALNNQEAFGQAVENWERIQTDPRERALVERELELRARDEALRRETTASQRQSAQQQAARIKALSARAANRYGVDEAIAQEFVARDMRANRQIPDIARIESIVKNLKPKEKVMTPEQAKRVKQTPTQSLQTTEAAPRTPEDTSREISPSGLIKGQPVRLRDIVKSASKRYNQTTQE